MVESLLVIPAELCREFRRDVGEKMFMGAKMFNNVQNIQFTIVLGKGVYIPLQEIIFSPTLRNAPVGGCRGGGLAPPNRVNFSNLKDDFLHHLIEFLTSLQG